MFSRNFTRFFNKAVLKQAAGPTFGEAQLNPSILATKQKVLSDIQIFKYVLHARFNKNNTFLTLTRVEGDKNHHKLNPQLPFNEQVLYYLTLPQRITLSQSTGYLGFRKAQRGEYEASFQLSSSIFKTINEKKLFNKCQNLEVIVRGFGKGRNAFFDALKGKEGNGIRDHITRLSDLTPIAFGGNKAPARRRI